MDLRVTELKIEDRVGIVRLKRPERGNSWTTRMNAEYRWIQQQLDGNPQVHVIVVTGAGRQFCVGADFRALDHYEKSDADYVQSLKLEEMAQPGHGVRSEYDHELVWHWGLQKPVIAAINGACAGIAVALAAFCDLRYAVEGAKFTTATPRLGLPAEYGLSWVLPRIVGLTHTADILLSGRVFPAEEARSMGFLNAVFPAEGFEARVLEIATSMAATVSPIAAKTAKRQIYADLMRSDVGQSIEDSKALIGQLMKHGDFSEGLAALKEKRAPRFQGIDKEEA
jgi:enoyl-CoA hydratase/carnithine racemase